MAVTRVFDLLDQLVEKYPKDDILSRKSGGKWIKYSSQSYYEHSNLIAYTMLSMGFEKGDKAITIMPNRPEWNFIDMGLMLAGMVHVPVYTTLSSDDYLHIFTHSDAKAIFIGNESLAKKILPIIKRVERDIKIFTIEPIQDYTTIEDLYSIGKENSEKYKSTVEKVKAETDENEVATIIYTSGTTGTPKGVMLSHKNLVFNFIGTAVQQIRDHRHKMLSFLPLCHIYERGMNYDYQYLGISIYYAESLSTIASDLADSKADGFCAVPRVLEMMYSKLEAAGKDLSGIKKTIYKWAFRIATKFDYTKNSALYKMQYAIADKLVYSKWREKLGGKEMLVVSGGSAIQAKIIRLFTAAKMYIFEGYGMTEASPVIAVNNPKEMIIKIGTVGKKMEGTEMMIAEDGEILTRGPHVMLGYYKDPEYTKQVIDEDGWLHTGDIGVMVDKIFLKITDRKKEIFKLSAGKYIAPQVIENMLKESSYIENCMVVGENQKFASAIVIPDINKLHFWAAKNKVQFTDNQDLIVKPEVIKKINKEIEKVNTKLAAHEQVKRAKIIIDEWTPLNDMLSQTLKLKRNKIKAKYSDTIAEIYNND
ncbi:MAG: long-chain fatty acid--CoA ligase [Bacteroidales bacterium]|jgi:long-chain acyl-CoA synthetase|nr:long-chain fatty acid--CoA ligase [Bacteroidales bacterium]MDD3272614.1 long-chain fatty acid--CoA ligase [Bacteroidales bacterium]MDD4058172.1 long-chain fatty acid--CoA ligase [Bacteroidales bacterium]